MNGDRDALPDGEVHVWWLDEHRISATAEARVTACLSEQERARASRFRRPEDRRRVRLTRAVARHVLSKYHPTSPSKWVFGRGPHGKPTVVAPAAKLQCNSSRTRGMVVCAVARCGWIGVDVEHMAPTEDYLDTAAHAFSPPEVAAMRALGPEQAQRRFYALWTLKEALGKARGDGLGFQTHWSTFAIELPNTVRLVASTHESPADWSFALVQPRPSHQVAIAHRDAGHSSMKMFVRELSVGSA